ncbi:hypothetical protein ES702_05230 [subsurface metagenome]
MLSVKEAADFYDVSPARLKQIFSENKDLEICRRPNGYIKIPPQTMEKLNSLRGVTYKRKLISISCEKGGIGKSVLTLFSAINTSLYGIRTCVINVDPEMCSDLFLAKDSLDLTNTPNLFTAFSENRQLIEFVKESRYPFVDFIPASTKIRRLERTLGDKNPKYLFKNLMEGLKEEYGAIFFDLPPSFNQLCRSVYLTVDEVIMPVCPDIFSLESLFLTREDIEAACQEYDVQPPRVQVLKNRFSASKNSAKEVTAELNREFAENLLDLQIKDCAAITNALNSGQALHEIKGNHNLKQAFNDLTTQIFELDTGR